MIDSIKNARKIIVIDLLYLGDLMFATPFLKELRNNFSGARIDMVVNSNFVDIMEENLYLDNIYSYNKKNSLKEGISFARDIARNKYDLGMNIHGNWRTALLMRLINPDYTIAYGGKGRGLFADKVLSTDKDKHMVENYLDFLRILGYELKDSYPQIDISSEAEVTIKKKLQQWGVTKDTRLIAINTGGTWPTKRWTVKGFAELADILNRDYGKVVFVGSKADLTRVSKIIEIMDTKPVIATGETSLKELSALFLLCDLVISNDSGPVHVAAAVDTPTITIFGPSDEKKYKPLGDKHQIVINEIECRPCGEHECPLGHHQCMRGITVDDIINKIK